jgi:hypothetical protein
MVNEVLRDQWLDLSDEDKDVWRQWATWDKKRYERDLTLHEEKGENEPSPKHQVTEDMDTFQKDALEDSMKAVHVPKKRHVSSTTERTHGGSPFNPIPKKSRWG